MARMELRVRLWGWVTRHQASVANMTEADVLAAQRRRVPRGVAADWIFGTLAPEAEASGTPGFAGPPPGPSPRSAPSSRPRLPSAPPPDTIAGGGSQ